MLCSSITAFSWASSMQVISNSQVLPAGDLLGVGKAHALALGCLGPQGALALGHLSAEEQGNLAGPDKDQAVYDLLICRQLAGFVHGFLLT